MSSKKVLILIDENESQSQYKRATDGSLIFKGYNYNIWQFVKSRLSSAYDFEEYFSKDVIDFSNCVTLIKDHTYDLVVGHFVMNTLDSKEVAFTHPIMNDALVVLTQRAWVNQAFVKQILSYISVMLAIGIMIGVIVHLVNPERQQGLRNEFPHLFAENQSKTFTELKRTVLTVVASFFGEMGFLAERSDLSFKGIMITLIVMILSFVLVSFVQTKLVTSAFERLTQRSYIQDLSTYKLVAQSGYTLAKEAEAKGAHVTYVEGTQEDMIETYKSSPEIDGCLLTYSELPAKHELDVLFVERHSRPCGWITRTEDFEFLKQLNVEIEHLKDVGELQRMCSSHFTDPFACFRFE